MLSLLLTGIALACPLMRVEPPIPALQLRGVPRGSIVQVIPGGCSGGEAVAQLVHGDTLHAPLPALPLYLCLPAEDLRPIEGLILQQGGILQPITQCALPDGDFHVLPPEAAAALLRFEAGLAARAIPYDPAALRVSDAGWVELPLQRYDPDRQAQEYAREGLDSKERKRKAVVGEGPLGLYTHFQGGDRAGSDLWAEPDFALEFIGLAQAWLDRCGPQHGPQRCAPSLGDISWYLPTKPDPLGHRSHDEGRCVDLRLFRADDSRYEAIYNRPDDRKGYGRPYDRQLTQEFVDFVRERALVTDLFFNDRKVKGVRPWPKHDDHLHLCLAPPVPLSVAP